jgi:hypothetical protein
VGLANKSVVLYESIKVGKKWVFCPVDEDSSHFSDGPFYVSWYDGRKKQMDPVGRDPEHALRMANLKPPHSPTSQQEARSSRRATKRTWNQHIWLSVARSPKPTIRMICNQQMGRPLA